MFITFRGFASSRLIKKNEQFKALRRVAQNPCYKHTTNNMKARFLKRVYSDKYNYKLEVGYGDVVENQLITIIRELGETKVNNEYVEKPMCITPYKDSFGNPICYDDIVILDYGNNKVIEAKVCFDEHFGIINLKSLGVFIDFSTLANWVHYSEDKKNGRTIKVKFIDYFEKGIII